MMTKPRLRIIGKRNSGILVRVVPMYIKKEATTII